MTSPNSFDGEWVWLTHPDIGDSPNPVLREAAKFFERQGWVRTDPPEPDVTTAAEGDAGVDTSTASAPSPSRRRAPATPDAASGPAAPDENKE